MTLLETTLKLSGLGQGHVEAKQIKRVNNICLYQRTDDIYEVFIPKILPAGDVFGKSYPERESYPSNEDFGRTAWCYKNIEQAEKKFNKLIE